MNIMDFGHNSFVAVKGLKERIQEAEKENQMSREIKFRAWSPSEKMMFPDICWCDMGDEDTDFILMQFTGLKNKEGLEIDWWENDLLQSLGINKRIGQIKYDERYAEWRLYVDGNSWCSLAAAYHDGWKKVGNIHTHPELLEQDNE